MQKLGTALLSATALLAAGTASAEQPQWTYADIGYYQADSFGDEQTDAFTLNGSLGFLDIWHIQAGYIDGSLGQGNFSNDFDGWSVTVGAHPGISENTQLVANLMYFDTSYDTDGGEGSFFGNNVGRDGYGIGLGLRSNLTEHVEISGVAYWSDASFDGQDSNSDFDATNVSLVIGGRWHWTNNISTGATLIMGDPVILSGISSGSNSMNLDVRWTFDGFSL